MKKYLYIIFCVIIVLNISKCSLNDRPSKTSSFIKYYPNGKIFISGELRDKTKTGDWYIYDSLGNLMIYRKYHEGVTIEQNVYDSLGYKMFSFPSNQDSVGFDSPRNGVLQKAKSLK